MWSYAAVLGEGHRGPLNGKVWAQAPCVLHSIGVPGHSSEPTGKVCYAVDGGASASKHMIPLTQSFLKRTCK